MKAPESLFHDRIVLQEVFGLGVCYQDLVETNCVDTDNGGARKVRI